MKEFDNSENKTVFDAEEINQENKDPNNNMKFTRLLDFPNQLSNYLYVSDNMPENLRID